MLKRVTKASLYGALEQFLRATEAMDDDAVEEGLWHAYEEARTLLCDPVQSYPGGAEGEHIHPYLWKPGDDCDLCEEAGDAG